MERGRRMPGASTAYVEERKVRAYLLSFEHPDGRTKAAYFASFGFRTQDWRNLAEALVRHGALGALVEKEETPFGVQYVVEGPLECPDGRTPTVRSVWQTRPGSQGPRLVTAYPGKGRRS